MNLRADRFLKTHLRSRYSIPMQGGPVFHAGKFGTINIRKLTAEKIENLLDRGAQFIHRKETTTADEEE